MSAPDAVIWSVVVTDDAGRRRQRRDQCRLLALLTGTGVLR